MAAPGQPPQSFPLLISSGSNLPLAWKGCFGRACHGLRPSVFSGELPKGASELVQPFQALPWCEMEDGMKGEGRELCSPTLGERDSSGTEPARRRNAAQALRDESEDSAAACCL